MIPLFRDIVHALLWDQMAVRRWLRALAISFSAGGVAFGEQAAAIVGHPGWATGIKLAALVLAFIGGAISVGEKNPPRAADPASGEA